MRTLLFSSWLLLFLAVQLQTLQLAVVGQPPPYLTTIIDSNQCNRPGDVAVHQGVVYATCDTGVVSLTNDTVLSTVVRKNCNVPATMAVMPGTGDVIVGCEGEGVVHRSHGSNVTVIANSTQCTFPTHIGVSASSDHTVILSCGSHVSRVDLVTGEVEVVLTTQQCNGTTAVVSYFEGATEYVIAGCTYSEATVLRLNVKTGETEMLANSSQCIQPTSIIRDSGSGVIYAGGSNGVFQIQSSSHLTLIATDFDCVFVSNLAYDPQTQALIVACRGGAIAINRDGVILRIATFAQCSETEGLFIDEGYYYLGCYGGVTKLSSQTQSIIVSFMDCETPSALEIDTSTGTVYSACLNGVTSYSNNSVSVVLNKQQCYFASWLVRNPNTGILTAWCTKPGLMAINLTTDTPTTLDLPTSCKTLEAFTQDFATGDYYYSCAHGVVRFNPMTGASSIILNTTYGVANSIFQDVESNILYFTTSSAILALHVDGRIDVLDNGTACFLPRGVIAYGGAVMAICASRGEVTQYASVIMIRSMNISTVVSGSVCDSPNAIRRNPLTGVILVTCGSTNINAAAVIAIDGITLQTQSVIGSASCLTLNAAIQDGVSRTFFIACQQGVTAVTQDFKCFGGTQWSLGTCAPCDQHSYRPALNPQPMGQCTACKSGFVAPQTGSTECTPCPVGTYESNKLCLFCAAGKYQPQLNATTCVDCEPGSYSVYPGSNRCTPCEAGSYSTNNGSVSCFPCNSGSASNVTGLTHACEGCPAGSYQASVGQTSCLPCPPKFYAEVGNSTSCTRCANQVNPEHTTCSIITCDADSQFNDNTNQCEPCPLSEYSSRGGKCTTCVPNSYTPAVGSGCASCDGIEGLTCNNGIASVAEGHWAFLSPEATWSDPAANPLNKNKYALYQTSPCPQSFCPGSALQVSNSSLDSSIQYCTFPRLNSPNNTLCALCDAGYLPWAESCVSCEQANIGLLFGFFILSFAFVLFLYHSGSSSSAGSLSIFLFFLQTAALELGPITKWLDWIQIMNLDSKSTSRCLAPWDAYDQTLFSLLVPLILTGELLLLAVTHFALHRFCANRSSDGDVDDSQNYMAHSALPSLQDKLRKRLEKFSFHHYRVAFISILLFCYTSVANTSLRYLHCVNVGRDLYLNFSAPTIDCRSSRYSTYLFPVSIALGLYIIAFPIGAFVMLWRKRDILYLDVNDPSLQSSPTTLSFLHHWSPLFSMYSPRAWFWQCWVLARRCVFVVVSVLLMQQSAERYLSFNLMHLASLMLHIYISPYHDDLLNRVETGSYIVLICVSAALCAYLPPYSTALQAVIFVLVVPTAVGMVLLVIYQRYQQISRWFSKRSKDRQMINVRSISPGLNDDLDRSSATVPLHRMESKDGDAEISAVFGSSSLREPMIQRWNARGSDL